MTPVAIPNRPVFRAQEVCEIAEVQPYVLRSWEAEFPDLGVAKTPASPRIYRRGDVERVLRLKHLLFVDGLTLAGARRKLSEEGLGPNDEAVDDADVAAMIDEQAHQSLREVKRGLQWILGVLSGDRITPEDRVLRAERPQPAHARSAARKAAQVSRSRAPKKSARGRRK